MGLLFKVDSERFYKLYQLHVQNVAENHVEWFVDEDMIHMYIITGIKNYYYTVLKSEISQLIKSIISKEGVVLGIIEQDPIVLKDQVDIAKVTSLQSIFKDAKA